MNKTAGPYTDYIGSLKSKTRRQEPLYMNMPSLEAAELHGPATQAELDYWDATPEQSQDPGIASYRTARRLMERTQGYGSDPLVRYRSSQTKSTARTLLSGALGSATLLGIALYNGKGPLTSALAAGVGFAGGAAASKIIDGGAALLAGLTPTRSDAAQEEYNNTGRLRGLAERYVPGVAVYDTFKTLGNAHRRSVESAKEKDAQKADYRKQRKEKNRSRS